MNNILYVAWVTGYNKHTDLNKATSTANRIDSMLVESPLASYPGHVFGGKSGLVSTVCACANDSGNFPRTSPNMDKLHLVVMRRNNQTRYTACSVAAVFTRRSVVSILLMLASYPGHVSCQILLGSQQLLVSYSAAVTDYSSAALRP